MTLIIPPKNVNQVKYFDTKTSFYVQSWITLTDDLNYCYAMLIPETTFPFS